MRVFRGRVSDDVDDESIRPPPPAPKVPEKSAKRAGATPRRPAVFPEYGAKPVVTQGDGYVLATLPVLDAALRPRDLVVRIGTDRGVALIWDGQLFGSARWVGSGMQHVYGLDGGAALPRCANTPAAHVLERAILEIEIAVQSAVRAAGMPSPASARRVAAKPTTIGAAKPAAPQDEPWIEPADPDDAQRRREKARLIIIESDARLAELNAEIAGIGPKNKEALAVARLQLIQGRNATVAEAHRLKAWCANRGMTPSSGDKAPLWEVLRVCHGLLERVSAGENVPADDIDACLDRIEYCVPKRYLDESQNAP